MGWMTALQIGAGLFSMAGSASSAKAARENALAKQQAAEYEAKQLEQQAGQVNAAAQRKSAEEQRQARLVASRALAVAAASGGGASDPTVMRLLSRIAGEGEYRSAVAIYDGEDRARMLRMKAATGRYEGERAIAAGESAAEAYLTKGLGMGLSIGTSMFDKYAGRTPAGTAHGDAGLLRDTSSYATPENPWGASI